MLKTGRLVDQGAPADLLARYGRANLEQVFLDIARTAAQARRSRAPPTEWPARRAGARAAIGAMIRRHLYLLKGSWPRLLELAYWPTVQMILWGFITQLPARPRRPPGRGRGPVPLGRAALGRAVPQPALGLAPVHGGDVVAPSRPPLRLAAAAARARRLAVHDEPDPGPDRGRRRRAARDPDPPVLDLRRPRPGADRRSSSTSCGSAGRWA